MDWNKILMCLMEAVISLAVPFLFALLRSKIKNETALKLVAQAEELVKQTVWAVEQTIVKPAKELEVWDDEAKAQAFAACKDQVLDLLNENLLDAIQLVYSDLDTWLDAQIEGQVNRLSLEQHG